jgi:phosphocarrier protein
MGGKLIITDLALTASRFRSSIVFVKDHNVVDGKSVMGLYSAWTNEDPPRVAYIEGPDKEEARSAIEEVFKKHGLSIEFK